MAVGGTGADTVLAETLEDVSAGAVPAKLAVGSAGAETVPAETPKDVSAGAVPAELAVGSAGAETVPAETDGSAGAALCSVPAEVYGVPFGAFDVGDLVPNSSLATSPRALLFAFLCNSPFC